MNGVVQQVRVVEEVLSCSCGKRENSAPKARNHAHTDIGGPHPQDPHASTVVHVDANGGLRVI
jgi:hypothetical protein